MTNKLNTLVFLAAAAPVAVFAQSMAPTTNVTFYGKVDEAIDLVRFSSTATKDAQSARYLTNDISFWGIRGSEDLGSGTRAYFKLESGINVDTGGNSGGAQFFDRETYIGYGAPWGAIQLGSQYSPSLFVQARSDPFSRHSNGTGTTLTQQIPGNLRGFLGATTQNNAIQYISPTFSGVTAKFMYGLTERIIEPREVGRLEAVSVDYAAGPIYLGVAFEEQMLPTVPAGGSRSNRTLSAGGSYDFKVVKLYGYLTKNRLTDSNDVNTFLVGLNYPFGASTIKTTYAHRNLNDVDGGKTSMYALAYYYDLSKRTTLYSSFAHMNNGAATSFGLWPSNKTYSPPIAAGGSGLPVLGQNINSLEFGVRHTF